MVRKSNKPDTGDASTTTTAPAQSIPDPTTFTDGLPLPKLFVFDLDYTLWPFWVDTHVSGPLKPTAGGLVVKDRYNDSYGFYEHVAGILVSIKRHDILLAAASRTHAPELAREMLSHLLLPITSSSPSSSSSSSSNNNKNNNNNNNNNTPTSPKALQAFDHLEIFPGDKKTHFSHLRKSTGLAYEEMLFFDDESRNKNVETLGVVMKLVTNGVTRDVVDDGVRKWRVKNGRNRKEEVEGE